MRGPIACPAVGCASARRLLCRRRNALAGLFMVKDRRAVYAWLDEQAAEKPPTLIVPRHGVPLTLSDPVAEVRAALA